MNFQAKHCDDLGIPADKSAILFLYLGIFATLGRLGGGLLCNLNFIKTNFLLQGAALVMGASTMIMTLAKSYGALVAYAIAFSLGDGLSITTFVILCLNSVEQSKKASAFGFTLLSSGLFATGGPPLAGEPMSHIRHSVVGSGDEDSDGNAIIPIYLTWKMLACREIVFFFLAFSLLLPSSLLKLISFNDFIQYTPTET